MKKRYKSTIVNAILEKTKLLLHVILASNCCTAIEGYGSTMLCAYFRDIYTILEIVVI